MRKVLLLSFVATALLVAACTPTTPAAAPAPVATEAPAAAPEAAAETAAMTETVAAVESAAIALPEVDPAQATGPIISAGSSTVYPLTEAVAEMFIDEGYADNLTIDSIGTGAGFERFCKAGETDISNASRAIKDSEKESCAGIGREPLEFRVGTDALAIVVNPENTWLSAGLTKEQIAKIFSSEVTNWNEVDPSWPAEAIKRYSPGTDSGTFDYFIEAVMTPVYKETAEETLLKAANLQLSEDDNVLVQGIEGDKNAIGYFGFAYYEENASKLQDLSVNGVAPSADTVNDGSYPLARPLFIYSTAKIMQDKPQVAAFIAYYLTNVNDLIRKVGYFPAPAQALDAARQTWLTAMGQ